MVNHPCNGERQIGRRNWLSSRRCSMRTHEIVSLHIFRSSNISTLQVLAWNYRRYVLASMPDQRPLITELAYTTRKIGASFSNFSAWHQRSKVYSSLWNAGELNPINSREEGMSLLCLWCSVALTRNKEFDLVHNALFTDPDDQSAWIYHRWLICSGVYMLSQVRYVTITDLQERTRSSSGRRLLPLRNCWTSSQIASVSPCLDLDSVSHYNTR